MSYTTTRHRVNPSCQDDIVMKANRRIGTKRQRRHHNFSLPPIYQSNNTCKWLSRLFLLALSLTTPQCMAMEEGGIVTTDKTCYLTNEDIRISFELHDKPGEDDWVGIYTAKDVHGAAEPSMWVWTCGTQTCWGKISEGELTFGANGAPADYIETWPLPEGNYHAVVARNPTDDEDDAVAAYHVFAVSDLIQVVAASKDCSTPSNNDVNSSPTSAPTLLTLEPTVATLEPTVTPTTMTPTQPDATHPPTSSPSVSPTPSPSEAAPTPVVPTIMASIIANAKHDIWEKLDQDPSWAPLFLRLAFQDCITGCNGCIDAGDARLEMAVDALSKIATTYELQGLTRPDVWALAAINSVEYTLPVSAKLALPFTKIGRQPCLSSTAILSKTTTPSGVGCAASNMGTDDLVDFFDQHFGFTPQETAAIMGGHTIGVLHRNSFGFDGPNGRTVNHTVFDNSYYQELVGPGATQTEQVNMAPNWRQVFVDNSDLKENNDNTTIIPNVFQWEGYPNNGGNNNNNKDDKIVMVNADIALVRQLHEGNMAANGKVACHFVPRAGTNKPACPMARTDLMEAMARYRNDNIAFLNDFRHVLFQMTQNGYAVDTNSCNRDGICRLLLKK